VCDGTSMIHNYMTRYRTGAAGNHHTTLGNDQAAPGEGLGAAGGVDVANKETTEETLLQRQRPEVTREAYGARPAHDKDIGTSTTRAFAPGHGANGATEHETDEMDMRYSARQRGPLPDYEEAAELVDDEDHVGLEDDEEEVPGLEEVEEDGGEFPDYSAPLPEQYIITRDQFLDMQKELDAEVQKKVAEAQAKEVAKKKAEIEALERRVEAQEALVEQYEKERDAHRLQLQRLSPAKSVGSLPPESLAERLTDALTDDKEWKEKQLSVLSSLEARLKSKDEGSGLGGGKDKPIFLYDWASATEVEGTTIDSVKKGRQSIDADMIKAARPGKAKQEVNQFFESVHSTTLLWPFNDKMTQLDYEEQREALVLKLLVLAQMAEDKKSGEDMAIRYLRAGVKHYSKTKLGSHKKLTQLEVRLSGKERTDGVRNLKMAQLLEALDKSFSLDSQVAVDQEVGNDIKDLTIEMGNTPSEIIDKARAVLASKYAGNPQAEQLVDREVRSLVMDRVGGSEHSFMSGFKSYLQLKTHRKLSTDEWHDQFTALENEKAFKDGLLAVANKKSAPSGGQKRVNVLMGGHPRDLDADDKEPPTAAEMSALRKVAAMALLGQADDTFDMGEEPSVQERSIFRRLIAVIGKDEASNGGGTTADASQSGEMSELLNGLRSIIASVGTGGGAGHQGVKKGSKDWVALEGVPGFAAPTDANRPALLIGRLLRHLGITINPKCPKDPKALVGPLCPCNNFRTVKKWYYHTNTAQFKDSSHPEAGKVPAPDEKDWAYYHGLGKCKILTMEAHKEAKKTGKTELLEPAPMGCADCITPA